MLIEKGTSEPASRIGEKGRYRPSVGGCVKRIHAFGRNEINLQRIRPDARRPDLVGGIVNRRLVGRDQEIEAVRSTTLRELETNSRRSAGDDSKRTNVIGHAKF